MHWGRRERAALSPVHQTPLLRNLQRSDVYIRDYNIENLRLNVFLPTHSRHPSLLSGSWYGSQPRACSADLSCAGGLFLFGKWGEGITPNWKTPLNRACTRKVDGCMLQNKFRSTYLEEGDN